MKRYYAFDNFNQNDEFVLFPSMQYFSEFCLGHSKFDTRIDSSTLILPKSGINKCYLDRKQYSFRIRNKATICFL